jgi:hypothetical protein
VNPKRNIKISITIYPPYGSWLYSSLFGADIPLINWNSNGLCCWINLVTFSRPTSWNFIFKVHVLKGLCYNYNWRSFFWIHQTVQVTSVVWISALLINSSYIFLSSGKVTSKSPTFFFFLLPLYLFLFFKNLKTSL